MTIWSELDPIASTQAANFIYQTGAVPMRKPHIDRRET